ncbi:hypothetical protein [Staphylococcus aureus]|uniref:hypothetical protein n=1 Tax=Staphylococcus aureus TaxID=1280 RepID=UPI000F446968|nr:hypothetical protein [Staphylococcus aureus]RNM30889.1 hypothetical protein EF898_14360 [Staphylococcus aureus]
MVTLKVHQLKLPSIRDKKNAYSAMVNYDQNGVYIGLGYDNSVYGKDTSGWRLAGSVDMGK